MSGGERKPHIVKRRGEPRFKCHAPWRYFPTPKRPYETGEIWSLPEKEFKVYHYLCWKTWGFDKASDAISLPQMRNGIMSGGTVVQAGLGYSERTLRRILTRLADKGWIAKTRNGCRPSIYGLNSDKLWEAPKNCEATKDGPSKAAAIIYLADQTF